MGICLHQINGSQYNVAFHIASTKNQQFNYSMNMQLLPRYKFQHSLSRTLNMYTVMSKLYRPTTNLDVDDVMASDCKAGLGWTVTATSANSCIVVVLHDSHVCVPFSIYQLALLLVYISSSTPLSPSVDKVFV